MPFPARVRTAHSDAWELDGRLRAGSARVAGARLSCSGLQAEYWNAAHVTGLPVDLDAARQWYAERGCPWGIGVPQELNLEPGEYLFTRPCMGLEPDSFTPALVPSGLQLRPATPADRDIFTALDVEIFGGDPDLTRAWIAPTFDAPGFSHMLGLHDDQPVALGSARRTDFDGGPCGTLSGIGTRELFRNRGIGAALTSSLCAHLFESGASLVHLDPVDDRAARVYARLGFREVPGFRVYRMA